MPTKNTNTHNKKHTAEFVHKWPGARRPGIRTKNKHSPRKHTHAAREHVPYATHSNARVNVLHCARAALCIIAFRSARHRPGWRRLYPLALPSADRDIKHARKFAHNHAAHKNVHTHTNAYKYAHTFKITMECTHNFR